MDSEFDKITFNSDDHVEQHTSSSPPAAPVANDEQFAHLSPMSRLLNVDYSDLVEPVKPNDLVVLPKITDMEKIVHDNKPAMCLRFDIFDITDLKKQLKCKRSMMDDVANHYFEACLEAKRLKTQYTELFREHSKIRGQVQLRESLQLVDIIQCPINKDLHDRIESMTSQLSSVSFTDPATDSKPTDKEVQKNMDNFKDIVKPPCIEGSKLMIAASFKHCCELCSKQYKDTRSFKSHLESHTGVQFTCNMCAHTPFTSEKSFKEHYKFHLASNQYFTCSKCGKHFEKQYGLQSHMKSRSPPTLKCRVHPDCSKLYTYESERKYHENKANPNVNTNIYQCNVCFKFYTTDKLQRKHAHSHESKK